MTILWRSPIIVVGWVAHKGHPSRMVLLAVFQPNNPLRNLQPWSPPLQCPRLFRKPRPNKNGQYWPVLHATWLTLAGHVMASEEAVTSDIGPTCADVMHRTVGRDKGSARSDLQLERCCFHLSDLFFGPTSFDPGH